MGAKLTAIRGPKVTLIAGAIITASSYAVSAFMMDTGQPMYVAVYMIAIVALCLLVYLTLPETGSRAHSASVAPTEPTALEDEHLVSETASAGIKANGSVE